MATRGFLIRFIDIGLIVLFGFLMISDIEAASRVDLAGSPESAEETVEPDAETAYVLVRIAADGAFLVGAPEAAAEDRVRFETKEALTAALERLSRSDAAAGRETVVLIEPHPASAVQRTVDVMDVADRLGIAKSLQMDIEIVPAPADSMDAGEGSDAVEADTARTDRETNPATAPADTTGAP